MKHILKAILLATVFSQGIYAATCETDLTQIRDQIAKYGSVTTIGCPPDSLGYGINNVILKGISSKSCAAACVYAHGGALKNCNWEIGNWGNSLTCP